MNADVVIVGGGASGLAAAGALAREGLRVLLLEKQARVGRKLLSTGNGRCNLTNVDMTDGHYYGSRDAVRRVLQRWSVERVRRYFDAIGVPTVVEEGRVYPRSRQAASVLDALRLYAAEAGAALQTDAAVVSLRKTKVGFEIRTKDGFCATARCVLVCTGGMAAPGLGACGDGYALMRALGHESTPRFPAVTALRTETDRVRSLKGQRMEADITLMANDVEIRREHGEVLFQDAAISGIAAMQLARHAHALLKPEGGAQIRISALPAADAPAMLRARCRALPDRTMEYFLSGIVPKRIGMEMVKYARVPLDLPAGSLTESQIRALGRALSDWRFPLRGVLGFEHAQVTAGGVSLADFDWDTLQSKKVPGLYAAGEMLDVDGDCGGYNLHWAWASALAAADAISRSLK